MTRTKSKLGTDKKLKSVTRRKPKKGDISSTTSLCYWGDYPNFKFNYQPSKDFLDQSYWHILSRFLLWTGIIILGIWIIGRIIR